MKSDIEILSSLLESNEALQHASIHAIDQKYSDRAEVLSAFMAFPGEGWLCTSESTSVYRLPENGPSETEYPLHGERADGNQSLHLRQDGAGGWILTQLEETAVESGPVCHDAQLAGYKEHILLKYRVCHEEIATLHDLVELRPVRARFAGFRPA